MQQVEPLQKLHLFSGVIFTLPAGTRGMTVVMAVSVVAENVQSNTAVVTLGNVGVWRMAFVPSRSALALPELGIQ